MVNLRQIFDCAVTENLNLKSGPCSMDIRKQEVSLGFQFPIDGPLGIGQNGSTHHFRPARKAELLLDMLAMSFNSLDAEMKIARNLLICFATPQRSENMQFPIGKDTQFQTSRSQSISYHPLHRLDTDIGTN